MTDATVAGGVIVREGGRLEGVGTTFSVGGDIRVGASGWLNVSAEHVRIGGDVRTDDAFAVTLGGGSVDGGAGEIGGDVRFRGGVEAAVGGMRIAGDVRATGQTRNVTVSNNTIGGSMTVVDANAIVPVCAPERLGTRPRFRALNRGNRIARPLDRLWWPPPASRPESCQAPRAGRELGMVAVPGAKEGEGWSTNAGERRRG